MTTCDVCEDDDIHAFFSGDAGFVWKLHITTIRPAERGLGVGFNRYPHHIIGAYAQWRGRGISLTWKGSRYG